jgi:RecA-family ATPase
MSNVQPMFEPDAGQMRRHVGHLFEGWLDGCHEGRIELAWTDARDGKLRHAQSFGTDELDELVERAVQENRLQGQNVYIGQALRQPDSAPFERGKDGDFFALTAYYVDIDDDVTATASINYRNRGCPPTGVVVTGRHPHVRAQMLWRLESPVRDAVSCRLQNIALANALDGDLSVINPSRVLRLGGSIAWPSKEGRVIERTEFLDFDDSRPKIYYPEQIARAFPPEHASLPANAGQVPQAAPKAPVLPIGTFSVDACIAAIRAGDHWHDNMLRLVGHWIARGRCDAEILAAAEAMTLSGYTIDATRRDVARMIAGGRAKWRVANPEPEIDASAQYHALQPGFLYNLNLALLPRRRWILGRSLLRGHVSLLVAPAGVGKSTHGIARAVAVATGRDLTGESVHEEVKAWIYNIEDDLDELKRRLGAVLQHWSVPFSEVSGRIALNAGADRPLLFAKVGRHDQVIRQLDVDACIAQIREHDIGLFVVDPFVEAHAVNENSNEQIKTVVSMFRDVARAGNCSVLLVHHTAKPPQGMSDGHAGNMNTARGASSLVGVARVVQTLFGMSETDAQENGVSRDDRHQYLRLDDAKANLGLTSSESTWYRKIGVELPNGDEVGVLVPHQFESTNDRLSGHTVEILKRIDERWRDGNPFSASRQSPRYVVPMMIQSFGLSRKDARNLLGDWIASGLVVSEPYDTHAKAQGLKVLRWPG